MSASSYRIKPGYTARVAPEYFPDAGTVRPQGDIVWQPEVYQLAGALASRFEQSKVIDLGCGTAEKLMDLPPGIETIGVDYGVNLDYCRREHASSRWIEADFETATTLPLDESALSNSVIVCADVIEHLVDPTSLMELLRNLLTHAPLALLSSPDRNLKDQSLLDHGPPFNPHHVREWTRQELAEFARSSGLDCFHSSLTITNDLRNRRNTTLLALAGSSLRRTSEVRRMLPRSPNPLHYWARVLRKTFGEWRREAFHRAEGGISNRTAQPQQDKGA